MAFLDFLDFLAFLDFLPPTRFKVGDCTVVKSGDNSNCLGCVAFGLRFNLAGAGGIEAAEAVRLVIIGRISFNGKSHDVLSGI